MLKKGDIILTVCILAVVALGFAGLNLYKSSSDNVHRIAVIKHNNRIIKKIDLDMVEKTDRIIISKEYDQVVLVENGRIRFEESECPDEICVKTGWLSKKGDTAICVPNKTIIVIEGEEREVDGVTY